MHNGFEDLDLDRLRRRRSEKWRLHPPDVLPAFIAEMDYDLAEPVVAALRTAVDSSDCGYATLDGIGETFAAFAAARHGWTVDPGRVHLVPDVMAGFDAILALATEPGDGVVINPPVYPPFFQHIDFARRRVAEVPLARDGGRYELDFAGLEAAFAAGARAYLLCNPHNPTGRVFTPADLGADRVARRAVRRPGAGRRDPRLAHPARRAAHAVRLARRRGG
jgi:cysteine-S-conjugate beta-lyase